MGQLADSLSVIAETSNAKQLLCPVAQIIAQLDNDDAVALQSALDSPASTRKIHQALRAEKYSIDRGSIQLHRELRCRCIKTQGENK